MSNEKYLVGHTKIKVYKIIVGDMTVSGIRAYTAFGGHFQAILLLKAVILSYILYEDHHGTQQSPTKYNK